MIFIFFKKPGIIINLWTYKLNSLGARHLSRKGNGKQKKFPLHGFPSMIPKDGGYVEFVESSTLPS
jgi:hypothetical protein